MCQVASISQIDLPPVDVRNVAVIISKEKYCEGTKNIIHACQLSVKSTSRFLYNFQKANSKSYTKSKLKTTIVVLYSLTKSQTTRKRCVNLFCFKITFTKF